MAGESVLTKSARGLSIKHLVGGGFSVVLGLFAIVVVLSLMGLGRVNTMVSNVIEENQPAVVHALRLSRAIDQSAASLGFYLLSHEKEHRESYLSGLETVNLEWTALKTLQSMNEPSDENELQASIEKNIEAFQGYQTRMLELASDNQKNIPANVYASEVSSNSLLILGTLTQMIESAQETIDEEYSGFDSESLSGREIQNQLITSLEQGKYQWARFMADLRGYLAFRDEQLIQNIRNYEPVFEDILSEIRLREDYLSFEQEEGLDILSSTLSDIWSAVESVLKVHGSEQWRMDSWLIRSEIGPLVIALKNDLDTLIDQQIGQTEQVSESLESTLASSRTVMIFLAVIGLILGVFIARAVSSRIQSLMKSLATAFSGLSHGDLTTRLEVTGGGEAAEIAAEYNSSVADLQSVMTEVSTGMNGLINASTQLTEVTERTSDGAFRQQGETQQVATAMTQMSASADEVARNAEHAAESARSADDAASGGQQVVSQTIESISNVASEIGRVSDAIGALEHDTNSIGAVLEVIGGISEQTNLLALNAAIEAARAGEQGRGFAVVADEVRTLASRTQQSTQEIQSVIENLQQSAKLAVKAMEESKTKVDHSVDQAKLAGQSLSEITDAVTTIRQMNGQIAGAAEQQREMSREVDRNIENISVVAEQTASGASETASSGKDLSQVAANIQSLVANFKI